MTIKAVGFDFFGTLVKAKANETLCVKRLHQILWEYKIGVSLEEFLQVYKKITSDYRQVRYASHKEVDNCTWIAETIKKFGYNITSDDQIIVKAVEAYFSPWILTIADDVLPTLYDLRKFFILGLVSNFTCLNYIYRSLDVLGLSDFFNCILVSEEVGFRKPNPAIFKRLLDELNLKSEEVLFVGDDLGQDILGAKGIGMKTVLVIGEDDRKSDETVKPDYVIHSIGELKSILNLNSCGE